MLNWSYCNLLVRYRVEDVGLPAPEALDIR